MGVAIKVENLTVVFGTPKQKAEALKLGDKIFKFSNGQVEELQLEAL